MNPSLLTTLPWTFLLGTFLLTGLAWIGCRCLTTPIWQRLLWRLALAGYLVLAGLELSGSAHWMVSKLRGIVRTASTHGPAGFDIVTDMTPDARFFDEAQPAERTVQLTRPATVIPQAGTTLTWLFLAWFMGAAGMVGLLVWRRLAVQWLSHRTLEPGDPALLAHFDSLRRKLGIRRPVWLRLSHLVRTPVAWGVLRPTVCLPQHPTQPCTDLQRDVMLSHELAHLSAHDPLWYGVADLVSALFWWHPLAWWMRQRLRAVSEEAADEASLLIDNGPGTLAEYLVLLGRHFAPNAQPACLGMAGDGYRSALTRRVERLLTIEASARRPVSRAYKWSTSFLSGLIILAVGLTGSCLGSQSSSSGNSLLSSWRTSSLGLAFHALWPESLPGTPDVDRAAPAERPPSDEEASEARIQVGKVLLELGRYYDARMELREALRLNPDNATASNLFELVQHKIVNGVNSGTNRLFTRWFKLAPQKVDEWPGNEAMTPLEQIRDHVSQAGVDLQQPNKAIFYNDRLGMLMARGTLADLDQVEATIQKLNQTPALITLEIQLCEINQGPDATNALPGTRTGVLTIPQGRVTRARLQQQEGVDVLTAPKITTLSARQAQVKVSEIRPVVDAADPNAREATIETGPTIDVVPEVLADGQTISLKVIAWINEIMVTDPDTPQARQLVRRRYAMGHALVFDRQTMVLGDFADLVMPAPYAVDHPGIPADPPASLAPPKPGRVVLYITPTLIDPAGNALHDDADPGLNPDRIPPQPEPPELPRPKN